MAREKGATVADKAAHRLYDEAVLRRDRHAVCHRCGTLLATAYHEERLYSVGCGKCETITLVKARDPYEAARKVGIEARPADDWDEEHGDVLWWSFPIEEPPYLGSPISFHRDGSPTVPDHCTHWTPVFVPHDPKREG